MRKLITVLSSVALLLSLLASSAMAAPVKQAKDGHPGAPHLKNPKADKQAALKDAARAKVLKGTATPKGANQVVKVGKGQYVELGFEGEDNILSVLGEFGDQIHASYGGDPGPLHNEIPEPDRSIDNTTIWAPDFSQDYYQNLLYNKNQVPSMANWYLAQSGGRYSVNGAATDWVQVNYNEARYGTDACGSIVCSTVWRFVNESSDLWWDELVAETGSEDAANAYLAQFDVWDRYDYDGDGDFNEPDGYIDHFQSIHAGEGEETGGGAQGADAIWSHRWYAYFSANGPDGTGPHDFGGVQIGGSNYWIGDYTIEPENGGVGVFAHEFGHDLGLPDLYDTSGNTGGGENGTGWWTAYSQGSYGTIDNEGLGTYPTSMTLWERFQLGWASYGVGFTGKKASFKLGPVEATTKQLQGLFVVLPDKQVTFDLGSAYAGSYFYHSGSGNDLDNNMTKSFSLGTGPITLSFQARYEIEGCWDYAYVEVSTDGGATFTSVPTSASTNDNENSQNFGNGITGTSGNPKTCDQLGTQTASWVPITADLSAYANSTIQLRFRYWTDGAAVGEGFGVDEIAITGQTTDGAETDTGWTFAGFSRTTGQTTVPFFNAYAAEFRQYRSYDQALKLGPYNFVDPAGTQGTPNWVEHFPYQEGLLIWYWDTSFGDNNVGDHPGGGYLLPVDSHPGILHWSTSGATARPRIQSYDATFGLSKTTPITLHNYSAGLTLTAPSLPAVSTFNDMNSYWVASDPGDAPANGRYQASWNSVIVPHTGTTIRVVSISTQGSFMTVEVK